MKTPNKQSIIVQQTTLMESLSTSYAELHGHYDKEHNINQSKTDQSLPLQHQGNKSGVNIAKKPYVLFPRAVDHDVVSPPVGKGKPFTSKYTGVTWHKRALGWQVTVSKNSSITRKVYYIGIYDNEKDAAIAFDKCNMKVQNYPTKKLNKNKFPYDFNTF